MFSTKAARNILKDVNFPGDSDPTYVYCVSRTKRKKAVSSCSEHSNIAAAIQIQRFWRGHRTRCKLQAIFERHNLPSIEAISTDPSCDSVGKKKSLGCLYPIVKQRYREYIKWCRDQGLDLQSSAVLSFEDYCARIIQSWWRRLDDRNNQTGVRATSRVTDVEDSEPRTPVQLDDFSAAVIIQRTWRKHNDIKVFTFYRDLINFRGKGDPKLMLRCINPAEAKLMDKATGAHVKFRLGGDKFPPNIYYKVFTHRPIVDLCACSPRDYTAMAYRQKLPRDLHNQRQTVVPSVDDKENWYKRHENNGWRIVSDRFFLSKFQDPVTIETSSKQQDFHYSKVKRKEVLEKKRKQRKIEWLQKMYREGMLQARGDLTSVTTSAVHLAADQLTELSKTHGPEVVEDDDIDELLSWTNALNFDEYVTDWHMSASTAFSDDCRVNQSEEEDPYELALLKQPR